MVVHFSFFVWVRAHTHTPLVLAYGVCVGMLVCGCVCVHAGVYAGKRLERGVLEFHVKWEGANTTCVNE